MKRNLVILAALVLVITFGWVIYAQTKDEPKKNTPTSQNQSNQPTANDPTEGGKYLVITEWGVRFPKTEKIKDLIYRYDPSKPNLINFGLNSFAKKYSGCAPEKVGLGLGLVRATEINAFYPLESFTKIGGYFYAVGGGGVSCFDSPNIPKDDSDLSSFARGELSQALRKLEEY